MFIMGQRSNKHKEYVEYDQIIAAEIYLDSDKVAPEKLLEVKAKGEGSGTLSVCKNLCIKRL